MIDFRGSKNESEVVQIFLVKPFTPFPHQMNHNQVNNPQKCHSFLSRSVFHKQHYRYYSTPSYHVKNTSHIIQVVGLLQVLGGRGENAHEKAEANGNRGD
jgi:hypothetical protein